MTESAARPPGRVVQLRVSPERQDEIRYAIRSAGGHAIVLLVVLVAAALGDDPPPSMSSRPVKLAGSIPQASPTPTTSRPRPKPAPPRPKPREVEPPPVTPARPPDEPPDTAEGIAPPEEVVREEPTRPPPSRPEPPAPVPAAASEPDEGTAGDTGPEVVGDTGIAASIDGFDGPVDAYVESLVRKVSSRWLKPRTGLPARGTVVYFELSRMGAVSALRVETPSGSLLFDRAALRAVELAAPLPPIPRSRPVPMLKVHLEFVP